MLALHERLIHLLVLAALALVLFSYAPEIAAKLGGMMDKAVHAGEVRR